MLFHPRRRNGSMRTALPCAAHTRRAMPYRSPDQQAAFHTYNQRSQAFDQPMPAAAQRAVQPACDADLCYGCTGNGMVPMKSDVSSVENSAAPSAAPQTYADTYTYDEAFDKGTLFPELFAPPRPGMLRR